MGAFPEHDKYNKQAARHIQDFLEFLESRNLHLARSVRGEMMECPMSSTSLIQAFFGIDPQEWENERKAMSAS